jgi:hypothetical protein
MRSLLLIDGTCNHAEKLDDLFGEKATKSEYGLELPTNTQLPIGTTVELKTVSGEYFTGRIVRTRYQLHDDTFLMQIELEDPLPLTSAKEIFNHIENTWVARIPD